MRQKKVAQIRQLNLDLKSLSLDGQIKSNDDVASKRMATATIELYRRVRENAIALYHVLKEKLQPPVCRCPTPHDTGLLLEDRKKDDESQKGSGIRFRAFISVRDINWRAIDVEPLEDDGVNATGETGADGTLPARSSQAPEPDIEAHPSATEKLVAVNTHEPR
jgi:hypothetical protein